MQQQDLQCVYNRLERIIGARPLSARVAERGYSPAHRLIVEFSNGSRAFVKVATDSQTAVWLRIEHHVYQSLKADFMPDLLGWHDDGKTPLLVLKDLSAGKWSHVWTSETISSVQKTLMDVKQSRIPDGLPSLESMRNELTSWVLVNSQPHSFLRLGLCSASWLDKALPILVASENRAVLAGSDLLHLDVRSDNICFLGDRVVLVDWNWACVGNSMLDLISWLPSVTLEGGPLPEHIVDGDPNLVSLITGYWAHRAGMPPPNPNSTVREIQRRQLEIALPWCVKLLGLPLLA